MAFESWLDQDFTSCVSETPSKRPEGRDARAEDYMLTLGEHARLRRIKQEKVYKYCLFLPLRDCSPFQYYSEATNWIAQYGQ